MWFPTRKGMHWIYVNLHLSEYYQLSTPSCWCTQDIHFLIFANPFLGLGQIPNKSINPGTWVETSILSMFDYLLLPSSIFRGHRCILF